MSGSKTENLSLQSIMTPAQVPEELLGEVQARQIHSVEKLLTVICLGNVISMWAVLQSFWGSHVQDLLLVWGCLLALMTASFGIAYVIRTGRSCNSTKPKTRVKTISQAAMAMGVVWGLTPLIVLPSAEPMGQMALGIILVGLMFSGAIVLGRIPSAAFSFVLPVAAFFVISLQFNYDPRNGYLSVITVVYLCILAITIRMTHHQFLQQIISGVEIENQSEFIGLLLKDFEESTSDWLWQTDVDARMTEIPMAIGEEKSEYGLMERGVSIADLFFDTTDWQRLMGAIESEKDFRDLVLKVRAPGDEIWWSMTGKPIYENDVFSGFRGVASDVTHSKKSEDRIAYMAHYDDLTGLPNRASLHEELEKFVRKPLMENALRAVIWLDLDKFKWVNDTLGHPAGDELLKVVASRIRRVAMEGDIVARLGGDEFVVVIERSSQDAINAVLDEFTNELAQTYDISGSTVNCSASLGVRLFGPDDVDVDELLKHADLALYHAKERGRGVWSIFDQGMEDEAQERRQIENDLRSALERNELCLHFQPLICAETGELSSCETLLRWNHPDRGLIYPGEFIEYAEDCGLIIRLGEWVIRAALAEARRLPDHVRVGINISPLQIHSANLMTTIFNAVARNEIDPRRIELEITESVLLNNSDFTLERLHRLKEMGFRIALDDFGTGYSSLSYLSAFPFDKIKIDKCFVSDLETNKDSQKITIATLSLAKSLGLKCTAEGIETEFQADFLRRHGCDELQGYLFSKPKPIEELGNFAPIADVIDDAVASIPVQLPRSA